MVYYKYELRWTSSDNTLREPDASGSFFRSKDFPIIQVHEANVINNLCTFLHNENLRNSPALPII